MQSFVSPITERDWRMKGPGEESGRQRGATRNSGEGGRLEGKAAGRDRNAFK